MNIRFLFFLLHRLYFFLVAFLFYVSRFWFLSFLLEYFINCLATLGCLPISRRETLKSLGQAQFTWLGLSTVGFTAGQSVGQNYGKESVERRLGVLTFSYKLSVDCLVNCWHRIQLSWNWQVSYYSTIILPASKIMLVWFLLSLSMCLWAYAF